MGAVDGFNAQLAGSPYLLPADIEGRDGASDLLSSMMAIINRQVAVDAAFRSTASEIADRLTNDFAVRLVYESNAIERAGTDLEGTAEVLQENPLPHDPTAYFSFISAFGEEPKIVEVLGLRQAHDLARSLADDRDRDLSQADVRELHAVILPGVSYAGHYRKVEVEISGAEHRPPPPYEIPQAMEELLAWMGESRNPPLMAAVVHAWFAHIHPFEDGNGRIARLLANYILMKDRWPVLIIKSTVDRGEYYEALAHSDQAGDILPFFSLVTKALGRTLDEMSDPVRAEALLREQLSVTPGSGFDWWSRLAGTFTEGLRAELEQFGLRLQPQGSLDGSDFDRLRNRDPAGNGWYAFVDGPSLDRSLLLWFGYNSDRMTYSGPRYPSIFLSVPADPEESVHPFSPAADAGEFSVDEVVLAPTAHKGRVLVREGDRIARHGRRAAARIIAADLADWFDARRIQ